MHHAFVLSVFSSTFLVLTTLSGTTGDTGPQNRGFTSALPDGSSRFQTQAQSPRHDKHVWSDLPYGKRPSHWGKGYSLDYQIANPYDNPETYEEKEYDVDEDLHEDDKRGWSDLKGQWGKRDWSSFRGPWGKRDPAWHNLKGLWGKRSGGDDMKWDRMKGLWGKK